MTVMPAVMTLIIVYNIMSVGANGYYINVLFSMCYIFLIFVSRINSFLQFNLEIENYDLSIILVL